MQLEACITLDLAAGVVAVVPEGVDTDHGALLWFLDWLTCDR